MRGDALSDEPVRQQIVDSVGEQTSIVGVGKYGDKEFDRRHFSLLLGIWRSYDYPQRDSGYQPKCHNDCYYLPECHYPVLDYRKYESS